ncbi:MAG: 3-deoxy-manno-octulosonate cytidylyltransferase [Gammaproteobacteria bacterium]|nr:3-deoxy-manno-octulosonate cytidylyltransferase [Gammaproteobacteria bacterium]
MHIIIPARYASSRLPGKPLADVAGKMLLERVYERACATGAKTVVITTDDERVQRAAEGFGAKVCMTAATHASGTDRIGEVIDRLGIGADEVVINLQGDEPLMPPRLIREVGDTLLRKPKAMVATACHPITDREAFTNPNVVKVVCDIEGYATYFSRAPIPWPRTPMSGGTDQPIQALRHIGLYAYRAGFVARYCAWGPCPPEETEQLEQLRVLWHGERIAVCITDDAPGTGVDTPEDLERVRHYFASRS